jgi:hypothetical protein
LQVSTTTQFTDLTNVGPFAFRFASLNAEDGQESSDPASSGTTPSGSQGNSAPTGTWAAGQAFLLDDENAGGAGTGETAGD